MIGRDEILWFVLDRDECLLQITDYNDGSDVGKVEWIWRGFKSVFTDSDVFTLDMPRNLELDKKALLIGAAMHVDFYYFEKKNDN